MDTTATPGQTRSARTRDRVLQAAMESFRERGFEATTTASIAQRAGVAEGTVFLHFGNKLGLLTAVMTAYYDTIQHEAEATVERCDDAAERLHRLTDDWASYLERDWTLIRAFISQAEPGSGTELADVVAQLNRRYTRLHVGVIRELQAEGRLPAHLPASLLRDMILGTLEHAARGSIMRGEQLRVRQAAHQVIDLLLLTSSRPAAPIDALSGKLDRVLELLEQREI